MSKTRISKSPILFMGDVHGQWPTMRFLLERTGVKDASVIQVGDFGAYGRQHEVGELDIVNNRLANINCTVYAIRGNHDNPDVWSKKNTWPEFSHIKFVSDYTVLTLDGLRIGCWGGAHSIDRSIRTPGKDWWQGECITFDDEKVKQFTDIDILVQHTVAKAHSPLAGTAVSQFILNYTQKDFNLISDMEKQNECLEKYFKIIKAQSPNLTQVIHGDYHISKVSVFDGCIFRSLGIDEIFSI